MSKIWFPGEDKLHQASTQEEMGSWNDEPLTALELEMMVCDFVSAPFFRAQIERALESVAN